MVIETAENGRCTMQWEGHSFFHLGLAKAVMAATATMAATTTMMTLVRTMAMMANYGSNPFTLPSSCAVKNLENAVKLLEEHYSYTILVAHSNICVMEPVC
jgi:hypothetical protein